MCKLLKKLIIAEICQVCSSSGPRGATCPVCGNPIP